MKGTSLQAPISRGSSANMAPISIKTVLISESVDPCCRSILEENGIRVTEKQNMKRDELIAEIKVSLLQRERCLHKAFVCFAKVKRPQLQVTSSFLCAAPICARCALFHADHSGFRPLVNVDPEAPPLADATHPFFFSCSCQESHVLCRAKSPSALQMRQRESVVMLTVVHKITLRLSPRCVNTSHHSRVKLFFLIQ